MFGIVLWSDRTDSKAVIWCEDHSDLAYYSRPLGGAHVLMGAGDLVQFDLEKEGRHLRVVNPLRVRECVVADVVGSLRAAQGSAQGHTSVRHENTARILAFPEKTRSPSAPAEVDDLELLTVNRP